MPGWFDSQGLGADGYGGGQRMTAAVEPNPGQMNPGGAAQDPFAYTQGSLLTPWTQKFQAPAGSGGGYTPPKLSAFKFDQVRAPSIGRMDAPKEFSYGDFQAPTADNFQQDPGYQFRLKEGQRALQNSAAAQGTLLQGGTLKALQGYGQDMASQEYGAAYNRALTGYQTNRGNAAETFDRNFGAQLNTFNANTTAALGEGQLTMGAWDRNMGLARTQWQDKATAAKEAASARASNSAQSYNRALQQYQMERGDFRTNQDRQYAMLMGQADLDYRNASLGMGMNSGHAGNMGSIYGQQGNAQAAGHAGQGAAWGGALGQIGQGAMDYGMYQATGSRG